MFNDNILGAFGDGARHGQAKMKREKWNQFWVDYKDQQLGIIPQYSLGLERSAEMVAWESDLNPLEM